MGRAGDALRHRCRVVDDVDGAQHPQVAPAADLNHVVHLVTWAGRLTNSVGKGLAVNTAGAQGIGIRLEPDDLPATRDCHPLAVDAAEVVAVRLCVCGQWPEDGS